MFLLDTDVLSLMRRPQRAPDVEAWVAMQRPTSLFISVVSFGEIERGIERQRKIDPPFVEKLIEWLDQTRVVFADRLLPFGLAEARRWGRLSAALGNKNLDLAIAATALEHGLTVVTRNVSHFAPAGVATVDPFAA